MSNLNTKLLSALLLLTTELTAFLNYEKHDPAGYNSGNSRNGYYNRILHSRFGDLNISIIH